MSKISYTVTMKEDLFKNGRIKLVDYSGLTAERANTFIKEENFVKIKAVPGLTWEKVTENGKFSCE